MTLSGEETADMSRALGEVSDRWRNLGVDPGNLNVTISYGIFNDPQVWERLFASGEQPEALREVLLETPLFEDVDVSRVLAHARLLNDDRQREGKLDRYGMVMVRRQVTLRSPWLLDT